LYACFSFSASSPLIDFLKFLIPSPIPFPISGRRLPPNKKRTIRAIINSSGKPSLNGIMRPPKLAETPRAVYHIERWCLAGLICPGVIQEIAVPPAHRGFGNYNVKTAADVRGKEGEYAAIWLSINKIVQISGLPLDPPLVQNAAPLKMFRYQKLDFTVCWLS